MKLLKKMTRFEGFDIDWRWLMVQGLIVMFMGMFLALASATNPEAIIMSARQFSWLPVSGLFILVLGLIECMDAFFAKQQRDVVQNLQVGVLDTVVGALIVLSISTDFFRVGLMISAFLIVRGIVRIIFVFMLKLPHRVSTSMGGGLSIILGTLIFLWPEADGWFISLCLNIEIACRGWAVISFALWVKRQNKSQKAVDPVSANN